MSVENEQKAAAGRAAKRAEETIGVIMQSIEGRWWMADLLERCNTFTSLYLGDGDALGMAFRDGRADVGRFLLTQIEEHAPDLFARMMTERRGRIAQARKKAEEARKAAERPDAPIDETPAEAMLDEQERLYADEAAQAEKPKGR